MEYKYKKLTPFKMQCLTNFPFIDEDFDALSNYGLLCKIVEYLNEISKNNNELIDNIESLNNWFKNLDVQDEINNKLDEMAEDGTLDQIIEQYLNLNAILGFNTVTDMKNATNLINGSYARTYGFYNYKDGGGAKYKIRNITNNDIVDEMTIISLHNNTLIAELIETDINVKQFGAKGDAINNDTQSIQKALDYALSKGLNVKVPSTDNYYLITSPLILTSNRSTPAGYWGGGASSIYGEDKAKSRIVKIGNIKIDDKDVTLLCKNNTSSIDSGTGITIKNLSIENYDDTSFQRTSGYAIDINISRSTLKDLNIVAYSGIIATIFSSKFENIVFSCVEKALELDKGTSNLFRFMYAPRCNNPYKINSSYSTLMNVCCDDGKGTIFELSGMALSLIDCGCESKNAQYIFSIVSDYTTLKIDNFYMIRQIGDVNNDLSLNDCSILYSNTKAVVDINNISVAEFDAINTSTANSSVFKVSGNATTLLTTSLTNLRYYKNFSGTSNARMKLWGSRPGAQCAQRYSSQTIQFNYIVTANLEIYPFIGGYFGTDLTDDVLGNSINTANISDSKTIWLDCKDKYHIANGTEIRYLSQRNKGDVQIYNDPKLMNAFGLSITNIVNGYTWDTIEIPLVLRGTTSERPTQNLFTGLQYFDTTLNKPIWYNGSSWVDSTGNNV